MADINTYLNQIMAAKYGKDVRQAIHDSIQQINEDVTSDNEDIVTKFNGALRFVVDDNGNATIQIQL